ncbi:MAG: hydrogenase nickel incorporation protein HypA [Desulfurococcaceae archaeon]|nr:hydrogenase nickel incorporation protein HypA [Desulfurococcaceae archaeon]
MVGVHEWALAEAVVLTLSQYLREVGWSRVSRVVVSLGELQAVDREVFEFALKELTSLYGVEVGRFEVVDEEASFECRSCGFRWRLRDLNLPDEVRESIHFLPEAAYAYVRCPRCGSADFALLSGRGVRLVGVEP